MPLNPPLKPTTSTTSKSKVVKGAGLVGLIGAAATALVMQLTPEKEGREFTTYRDIAGVLTYCDGATENAQWGKTYTKAECDVQLEHDLYRHAVGINACMPLHKLTVGQRVAFVDTAFNIGVAGFCGSSMARLANAGKLVESCTALFAWNGIRKNGVIVPVKGLVLRRLDAIKICLTRT